MDHPTDGSRQVLDALPVHPTPALDPDRHLLRVTGDVDRPAVLTVDDLEARAQTTRVSDFECEEGWVVPALTWAGVPLAALIEDARPREEARWVTLASGDFTTTLSLEDARGALIVLALDGAPLPFEHGGPMRVLVPGGACFTSIKWLDRIEVTTEPAAGTARHIALRRIGREPSDPSAA